MAQLGILIRTLAGKTVAPAVAVEAPVSVPAQHASGTPSETRDRPDMRNIGRVASNGVIHIIDSVLLPAYAPAGR